MKKLIKYYEKYSNNIHCFIYSRKIYLTICTKVTDITRIGMKNTVKYKIQLMSLKHIDNS